VQDLMLFEGGSGLDELSGLETHDAALRYAEGSVPPGYTPQTGQDLQGLGDILPPSGTLGPAPQWYKDPTFLTVVGAGALALLFICWMRKRD